MKSQTNVECRGPIYLIEPNDGIPLQSSAEPLGQHHHTISTKNPEAQWFFDQGLTLVFGFNHEGAARALR